MSDDPDSPSSSGPSDIVIAITTLAPVWATVVPEVETLVRAAASRTLLTVERASVANGELEISVVLADDATVAGLNRDYRGIEGPTNVLAFASGEKRSAASGGPLLLGDVVLAFETLRREAEEQGKAVPDHLCHLVAHGVLHLLGFDHQTAAEATVMERLETDVLAGLGVADPYRQTIAC